MKVNEYLINRILKLEEELKQTLNEKYGVSHCLELQKDKIDELNETLDQYQREREHIKQIITCNIGYDAYNHIGVDIDIGNNDFKTLLAILDIKPEDYEPVKDEECDCFQCKHDDKSIGEEPCNSCRKGNKFEPKEVISDAETTD